jgi:hypothetical protein
MGLITGSASKNDRPELLVRKCRSSLRHYFANAALNAARTALQRHPRPDVEYMVIDGVVYSAIALFEEMVRETVLGESLLEEWSPYSEVAGGRADR